MKIRKEYTDDEMVENRLRHFINKYYRIKVIQGLILTVSVALLIVAGTVIFGSTIHAGTVIQDIIAVGSIIAVGAVLAVYILKPLGQRLGFIKGLNFKEASGIIQQKHKSIEDRIINIIELAREKTGQSNKLYDYAIAQKTANIRDIQFDDAISLKKTGIFLIRLLLLIAVSAGTVLLWPDFVKKGMGTMWSANEKIAELNKIEFEILNEKLEVESGKDFLLKFRVFSEISIDKVSVTIGSSEEKADKAADSYEYLFNAVNSAVSFRIKANGTLSGEYVLSVLKRPEISGIRLKVMAPSYTSLESSLIEGDGNAEVPAGSRIAWSIKTVNTDELIMIDELDSVPLKSKGNLWNYEKSFSKNTDYEILCKNNNGLIVNYFYKISIVKDLYPTIDISENRDSTVSEDVYIQGIIQDDYGFSKLEVIESVLGKESAKEVDIKRTNIYENFYYTIKPDSNSTVYFFRIWDNDRIGGPKFTESRKITLKVLSKAEIENVNSQLMDSIKSNMLSGMNAIDKMEKKISEFKMEQVVGDLKPWEIQEKLKELDLLKNEVVDFLNTITETNKDFTDNEKMLDLEKEMTEKAKQIQDLMQNLLDDELKDLLKQFEELSKEFNSKKADELTEKMGMNLEKLKEQMEMSLELLRKYDMEKNLMQQAEKLNQLADSLQKDQPQNEEAGNKLKEEFKKWEEEYEKNLKQDEQFKKPMGLEKMEQEREEVRKDAENLDKKESQKSTSDKKDKASKSLKKLAKKMNDMLGKMDEQGESVDLEELRQIRNSLNDYSKKQEELNNKILNVNTVNPVFTTVIKGQKELQDKFLSVRDSLKSLGYKQPVIAKIIGAELFHVETSIKNLFESYGGNRVNVVRIEQNRIMSEINMIAVKLDELILSLQNAQAAGKEAGKGKPGFTDRKKPKENDQKGSEKLGESKSMQESLKEQLKNSIQKMKSGGTGKKERGELARMLGEREMMRKALEKLTQGGGLGTEARDKANEALNMMKEVEKDIIYNRLSDQTLEKDNLIRTKLLEAENAEKERENENRRESKEFKGSFEPNRRELENGVDPNKGMEQMLKYNELKLKSFYQEKYLKYIESTKKK